MTEQNKTSQEKLADQIQELLDKGGESELKRMMNSSFAESVLMFAILDINKNGVKRKEDYMTPMMTAVQALQNKFDEEQLAQMMATLASVAKNVIGKGQIEV